MSNTIWMHKDTDTIFVLIGWNTDKNSFDLESNKLFIKFTVRKGVDMWSALEKMCVKIGEI
jgi:hypothetical protein